MVITELDEGGAEKAFVRIACGLQARGWKVHVVSLRDTGPLAKPLQDAGIPVTALHARGAAALLSLPRLTALLRRVHPEIVLSFLHEANLISRLAALLAGTRCCVSGIRVVDRRLRVTFPERLTWRLTTLSIACSESVAREHARLCGIPASRIAVVRNGVDVDAVQQSHPLSRAELGLRPDDFVLLMAGRLVPQKSPQILLQTLNLLQQRPQPRRICLVIAGEGPERAALGELAARLPDPTAVTFPGWRSDLPRLMKTADLFVLPSAWEGLPNVLLEAQAAGLPVAATAIDGCADVIQSGHTGLLFPPEDADAIARIISAQVRDCGSARAMASNALQQLQAGGRWEMCLEKFANLLEALLPQSGV
ncbi:MAG: glycosyltransferase [Planctomycetaceae bacterium]